ncbi:polymer-forming cytoskeletal protein [Parvularcula sp. ZS-1/3]|uniref:Polymer-forming cytoskeletal protein n=1 Tax=Parvularcula mediterranea TaxID=2732508 RepID=A0A7Y3W6H4_9PROT|nr:polymer-forming cytoskeletal protein [Parvularcula mediterranea]NNU17543.1 polymer-forming cytoskeletal protein [Parvularcula mediterranea]
MSIDSRLAGQLVFLVFLVLLLLFATAAVRAQVESRAGEEIRVEEALDDIAFFAGGEITLNPVSSDDVVAAGGQVLSEGLSAETLILAGGALDLSEILVGDAFLAGGKVSIPSGRVMDDVTVAGGELRLGAELDIGGTLHAAGGEVTINAPVGGSIRAAGGDLTVNGTIAGDADLTAERLVVGPQTRIAGNLRYRAKDAQIDLSAVVEGETEALPWPEERNGWRASPAKTVLSGFLAFAATALGAGLLAVVVAVVFPELVTRTHDQAHRKPLASLGVGVLVSLLGPAAIVALGMSVVGFLLGGVLLLLLLLLLPFGLAAMAFTTGSLLRSLKGATRPELGPGGRASWTALGYLAALLISLVPFVGPLLWMVLALLGVGAIARAGFGLLGPVHRSAVTI